MSVPSAENSSLKQIFYAMPFTGKSYEQIVDIRTFLKEKVEERGLHLLEQFVGVEEKEKFENHAYGPLFIAKKDHDLLKIAGIVIADYSSHSIGRDCEIIMAKEIFDKRIIAVVPDENMQNHPWIRLYSDYIVDSQDKALDLAQILSEFSLSTEMSTLTREQKDEIDEQIAWRLETDGLNEVKELFPTELKRRWKTLFGDQYEEILKASFSSLPIVLRLNTLNSTQGELEEFEQKHSLNLTSLAFSDTAFMVDSSADLNLFETEEYRQGKFYLQQIASMLPAIALAPQPGEKVLDIAAAPGSKTTQMAEMMQDQGEVLANDNSKDRMQILENAVMRHKLSSVKLHVGDGAELGELHPEKFDKVMVDTPCSSEGILRYKAHKFFEWYLLDIYRMNEVQKQLIDSGFRALKPGGTLVYSTCTFGPEENEAIVDHLLKTYTNAKIEEVHFDGIITHQGYTSWEHAEFDDSLRKAIRLMPHENNSTGFFLAKVRKT